MTIKREFYQLGYFLYVIFQKFDFYSKNRVAHGFRMIYIPSKLNERCNQNENVLPIQSKRRL